MKRVIAIAACILGVSVMAAAVRAQSPSPTLGGLSAEMTASTAELPTLNATMSQTTDANIPLLKERTVYIEDQLAKKAWLKAAVEQETEAWSVNKAPYTDDLAKYVAACIGSPLSKDTYDSCVKWKDKLDGDKQVLETKWKEHVAIWDAANVAPINLVITKQNARILVIDSSMKRNFASFTEAQDHSIALRKRITDIEEIFRKACSPSSAPESGFTADERLKWCQNVNWDGASTKLVPMYKYQGTGGATRNQ